MAYCHHVLDLAYDTDFSELSAGGKICDSHSILSQGMGLKMLSHSYNPADMSESATGGLRTPQNLISPLPSPAPQILSTEINIATR